MSRPRRQVRSAVFSTRYILNVISTESSRKRPSGRPVSSTYVINLQHCHWQHDCLSFAVRSGEVDWKTLSNILVAQALGDVCRNLCIACYVSYGTQRFMFFVTSGTVYLIY